MKGVRPGTSLSRGGSYAGVAKELLRRLAGHSRDHKVPHKVYPADGETAKHENEKDRISPIEPTGRISAVDVHRRMHPVRSVIRHVVIPGRMRRQVSEAVIEEAAAAIDAIGLVVVHMRGRRDAVVCGRRALRRWDRPVAAR